MTDPGPGSPDQAPQPPAAPPPGYQAPSPYGPPQPPSAPPAGYGPQPTPGYGPPPGYQPTPGYGPQPGYQPTPGYGPPPGYQPTPGYQQPSDGQPPYGPPPTYGPGGYAQPQPEPPAGGGGAKKSRKGLLLGTAIVVILAVVGAVLYATVGNTSSGSASTPADAAKRFAEAAKSGDKTALVNSICSQERPLINAVLASAPGLIESAVKVTSYSIGAVKQQDSTHATVTVSAVAAAGNKSETENLPMVKQGSSWTVCPGANLFSGLSSLSTSASGAASGAAGLPSGNGLPSGLGLPTSAGLPSGIGLPTGGGLPTDLGSIGLNCDSDNDTALGATVFYLGLAEAGETAGAQTCTKPGAVPESVTAKLSGQQYAPTTVTSPSGPFTFSDGSSTVTIKLSESDGKFYVVGVTFS